MAGCGNCGEPAHDNATFCSECGAPLREDAVHSDQEASAAADRSPNETSPTAATPPRPASPPQPSPSSGKRPILIGAVAAAAVGLLAAGAWFGWQQAGSADTGGVAIAPAPTTTTGASPSAAAPPTTHAAATTSTSLAPTTSTMPPATITTFPADLISSLETTGVFVEPGSSADAADLRETVQQARDDGFGLSVVAVAAEPDVGYSPYAGSIATSLNAETIVVVGPTGLGWASQEADFYQEEFERAWNLIPPGSTENAAVTSFVRSTLGGPDSVGVMDLNSAGWLLLRFDGTPTEFPFGDVGDLPLAADWTCSGIATPAVFRSDTGQYFLRDSATSGAGQWEYVVDRPRQWPLAGDFDGDGCATLTYYDITSSTVVVFNSWPENGESATHDTLFAFGDEGDMPFVGDFDGDDVDTIGLFRPSTGTFYLKNTHAEGPADIEFAFGAAGDIPIAGDWGIEDGIDTVGLYRPSTGTFFFRYENSAGPADETLEFGVIDGYPVAGAFGLTRSD